MLNAHVVLNATIALAGLADAIGRGVGPERDQDLGIGGRVAQLADHGFVGAWNADRSGLSTEGEIARAR